MVALTSRFSLLAALSVLTFVAPLVTNAAAVEGRHSDKSVDPGTYIYSGRERYTAKQPAIPLPHKSNKGGHKYSTLERDQKLKGKGKGQQRRTEWPSAPPLADISQAAFASTRKLQARGDDDCARKVIVNGDRDHVRLRCRRDHGHRGDRHDNGKAIVNGGRDHVQTRRDTFQPRSPRHIRPLYQRRNETLAPSTSPKGVAGEIEVTGTDGANGQDKVFGKFVIKRTCDIDVSPTESTTLYMVGANSNATDSSSEKQVTLRAVCPDNPSGDMYCCSYDPSPSGPQPMIMRECQNETSTDSGFSQTFLFNPISGVVRPVWRGGTNSSSVAGSTSPQTAGDQPQNKGDKNAKLIWKPKAQAQGDGAKLEPPSGGSATETRTVTVTVTVNGASSTAGGASSSAMREASTTLAQSSSTEPALASSSPTSMTGFPSTQAVVPMSTAQGAGSRPTDGLKVEVVPTQAPLASSQAMSSSSAAGETTSTTTLGGSVPAREGEILAAMVAPEDDDSDM